MWNPFKKSVPKELSYLDFGNTGKLELPNVEVYFGTFLNEKTLQLLLDNKILVAESWITQRGLIQPIIGLKNKIEEASKLILADFFAERIKNDDLFGSPELQGETTFIFTPISKEMINNLLKTDILYGKYDLPGKGPLPTLTIKTATMTDQGYQIFRNSIRAISDEKGVLILNNQPKYNIQLVLPKGRLSRIINRT